MPKFIVHTSLNRPQGVESRNSKDQMHVVLRVVEGYQYAKFQPIGMKNQGLGNLGPEIRIRGPFFDIFPENRKWTTHGKNCHFLKTAQSAKNLLIKEFRGSFRCGRSHLTPFR